MIDGDCASWSWSSKLKGLLDKCKEVSRVGGGSGDEVEPGFPSMSTVSAVKGACFCKWKQCQHKHQFSKEM